MRSVRLINLSVLLAMVGPLLLTGCFFPEEFDAHITIRRDGTYSLRYQGRLTFVLAAAATKQGTVLSPKDEAELARATQEFKEDPRFKVATYEGKGRFQTVYEDEGRLTGPVYFLNREVSLISIIPREDGLIVVSGLKIKPQDAEQLELLGLDFTGTITLSTDAEISEHNGTMSARTGEMRRATWTLHSIHDPPPSAVLRPSHVSSATGAKPSSPPREPQPAATARKYISAIQEPDWKTVISLTQQYQQSLNAIKASNPQALWERLTGEFYESTQRQLESEPEGFWVDYAEQAAASLGNPTRTIRALGRMLPSGVAWSITETRNRTNTVSVFVTVEYPTMQSAPEVDGQFLKETILEFVIDASSYLFAGVKRISAADVFWEPPYAESDQAFLISRYREEIRAGKTGDAFTKLLSLDWKGVAPVLLELLASEAGPVSRMAETLMARGEASAIPVIMDIIRRRTWIERLDFGCESDVSSLLTSLGMSKSRYPEASKYLKSLLSRIASGRNSSRECAASVLRALAALDSPDWSGFELWAASDATPQWNDINETVFGRIRQDLTVKGAGSRFLTPEAKGSPQADTVLQQLDCPDSIYLADCRVWLSFESVDILDATTASLRGFLMKLAPTGDMTYPSYPVMPYSLLLRRSDTVASWLVAKVESGFALPFSHHDSAPTPPSTYLIKLDGSDYRVSIEDTLRLERADGSAVVELTVIQSLTKIAWLLDSELDESEVSRSKHRVRAIADTLREVRRYEFAQDALARAFVEGVRGVLTGGAGGADSAARLTWEIVRKEFASPDAILSRIALAGLDESSSAYDAVAQALSRIDRNQVDGDLVLRIGDQRFLAHAFELIYGGLSAALMPSSAVELWTEALESATSQLLSGIPQGGAVRSVKYLYDVQASLAEICSRMEALDRYSSNFRLAVNLAAATDERIARWVQAPRDGSDALAGSRASLEDCFVSLPPGSGRRYIASATVGGKNREWTIDMFVLRSEQAAGNGQAYERLLFVPTIGEMEEVYGRIDASGVYIVGDSQEDLAVPFPLVINQAWKAKVQGVDVSCVARPGDTFRVQGSNLPVLEVRCNGSKGNEMMSITSHHARRIGLVKQKTTLGGMTVNLELKTLEVVSSR